MITAKVTVNNDTNTNNSSLFERLKTGVMDGGRKVVQIPKDGLKSGTGKDMAGFAILLGGLFLISVILLLALAILATL